MLGTTQYLTLYRVNMTYNLKKSIIQWESVCICICLHQRRGSLSAQCVVLNLLISYTQRVQDKTLVTIVQLNNPEHRPSRIHMIVTAHAWFGWTNQTKFGGWTIFYGYPSSNIILELLENCMFFIVAIFIFFFKKSYLFMFTFILL